MSKFSLIAMGGTFDIIHHGHITLLSTAFEISEKVIIGLTSDEFVQKKGKNPVHKYDERLKNLTSIIFKKFPNSKPSSLLIFLKLLLFPFVNDEIISKSK